MPVAAFDEPPDVFVNPGDTAHAITIGAATSNRGWIKQVTFCIAGNCTPPITAQIINPRNTGDVGWTVIPTSIGGTDNDYTLSAYVTPVNGFERKIDLPITLNNNGTLTRAQRFIDAVSGSDSNNGLTLGTAWLTLVHAEATAPSGSQVYTCGDETYLQDSNTATFQSNARLIEILINPACPGSGFWDLSRTSRTSPEERLLVRADKVRFDHVHVDMSKIIQIQGGNVAWFSNSTFIDPNGPTGPTYGYTNVNNASGVPEISQTPFGTATNFVQITDSTLSTVITAGIELARNDSLTASWDIVAWSWPNNNNAAIFDVQGIKAGDFQTRLSLQLPPAVTVASTSYSSPNATIVWSAGVTLATLAANSGSVLNIIGGPLDGQSFSIITQTPSASVPQTVVADPGNVISTIGIGTGYLEVVAHADCGQFIQMGSAADTPYLNIYQQRLKCTANGHDLQPLLEQPTPAITNTGTVTTVGTSITFSASQILKANDIIQIAGTLIYGVLAADVNGTTGTLVNALSVDQTGASWHQGKSILGLACVACIFDGSGGDLAQPQGGEINHAFIQTTFATSTFQFRTNSLGFGLQDFAVFDNLICGSTAGADSMTADASPGFPTSGINIDTNQFCVGTARGTNGTTNLATFASTGSAGSYKPTGGTVTKALSGMVGNPNYPDGTPLFPYAYDLTPLSSSSIVGAQQP